MDVINLENEGVFVNLERKLDVMIMLDRYNWRQQNRIMNIWFKNGGNTIKTGRFFLLIYWFFFLFLFWWFASNPLNHHIQYFVWFWRQWSIKKKCFWDLLTFSNLINVQIFRLFLSNFVAKLLKKNYQWQNKMIVILPWIIKVWIS